MLWSETYIKNSEVVLDAIGKGGLTLTMLWLLSSKAQNTTIFKKVLILYSQVSTRVPVFFASFCIGQISHPHHKDYEGVNKHEEFLLNHI